MDYEELAAFFDDATFSPLVITTKAGYSIAVEQLSGRILLGISMLYVRDPVTRRITHIPFHAIDHISQPGEKL
jgi:hypothetical protein